PNFQLIVGAASPLDGRPPRQPVVVRADQGEHVDVARLRVNIGHGAPHAAFEHKPESDGYRAAADVAHVHANFDAIRFEAVERQAGEQLDCFGDVAVADRRRAQPVANLEAANRPINPAQSAATQKTPGLALKYPGNQV